MQWFPIIPALVSGLVALFVAFGAFAWQRAIERKQQRLHEKRNAYKHFAEATSGFFTRVALGSKISTPESLHEQYIRAVEAMAGLVIYAPPKVLRECQKYSHDVFAYSERMGSIRGLSGYRKISETDGSELYLKAKRSRKSAMLSLRLDLHENTDKEAQDAIDAFFVLTPDDGETP